MTLIRGAGHDGISGTWVVPELYNAAVDSIDHHSPSGTAMIWCTYAGEVRYISWEELRDRSNQFARLFLARGVRQGDVVAVLLPQTPEAAAAYAGALRVGAVLMTMSLGWSEAQIVQRLEGAEAKVLVTERSTLEKLGGVGPCQPLLFDGQSTFHGVSSRPVSVPTRADDPAHLYYTSGTTGPAKALVHAQRSLIGHNEFEIAHGIRPGDVFYAGGDWAWSHAKLFGPWRHGATQLVYVSEAGFDADGLLSAVARHNATSALLNPTLIKAIRRTASPRAFDAEWAFKTVCSSNEPLDPDVNDWFTQTFGCAVREYYGLTESYPMLGYHASEPVVRGSTGRVFPGWDVSLKPLDDQDPNASADTGEAVLKARSNPQYPLGYWGQAELSRQTFGGEWFATGDTFRVDDNGYWYFLGRNDDVIKTSGYRVGPAEVEAVLEGHADVVEASVVGIPDKDRGQAICAFVVVAPESAASDNLAITLKQHVRDRYSRFAYPRIIHFVEELPKSSTGKVQRASLRDIALRWHQ